MAQEIPTSDDMVKILSSYNSWCHENILQGNELLEQGVQYNPLYLVPHYSRHELIYKFA